jgi:hypothetical protein
MIVNYVNPHKQGGVDLQEQGMSFYQDDDNEHQQQRQGRGIPRRGPGQGCGGRGPGGCQHCGTPGAQAEDNEEDNYHLEEEHEQFIGGAANTDNHHNEHLYPVILPTMNTPHRHPTNALATVDPARSCQYNLLQVSLNLCTTEKVVLEHHTLPTTWLLLNSCSTVDIVSNVDLLCDIHQVDCPAMV